jgi:DNA-binding NtrC family response regulator
MENRQNPASILIVEDEESTRLALKDLIQRRGFKTSTAKNADEALVILKKNRFDLMLTDIEMRCANEGVELIPQAKRLQEDLEILVFSGHTDFERVREAMRCGATDYVSKTSGMNELAIAIERSLARKKDKEKAKKLAQEVTELHGKVRWVGSSAASKNLLATIGRIRNSNFSILITGETGTGKEIVARLLRQTHDEDGPEPFVAVDASTIQTSIAESLLFGFEKGAFTGADRSKPGLFESANGGTIYFDEMGNMPLDIQAKLLRVLQEKEVLRLGASVPIQLDFRVISATNKNLERLCSQGQFKDDLLQRIAVFCLEIPPLRDRRDDIPELLQHFSMELGNRDRTLSFSAEAIAALQNYNFPGNARELRNIVATLYALCENTEIQVSDLPEKIQRSYRDTQAPKDLVTQSQQNTSTKESFYEQLADFERVLLAEEYNRASGNVTRMAAKLKMDRSHLHNKLKDFQIHSLKKNLTNPEDAPKH